MNRVQQTNRPRRKSNRGASRQVAAEPAGNALRWYTAGLVSGLLVALLLYVVTLPADAPPTVTETVADATPNVSAPTPEYEFYDVLPSQEITVDIDPADLPRPRSESTASQYLLQAGSFRQASDADRRRAELLLLGLDPRVEETYGDSGRWFRVIIGPFDSRSAMAKAKSLTAQQDIDTLLMQRKRG